MKKNLVCGKDFNVNIPHFYSLEYSEKDHIMNVEVDFRDPVPCLYIDQIKSWNPPYENEALNQDKKEEILENIHTYLVDIRGFRCVDIIK